MITQEKLQPTVFLHGQGKGDGLHGVVDPHHYLLGGENNGVSAHEVVDTIREGLRYLDAEIRDHLFLRMLRQKKVDLPTLRTFPGHQYHIIHSDLRSVAMMMHRFDKPFVQSFFGHLHHGEVVALQNILSLAQKLGMSKEELEHYPLTAEGLAYATYVGWLSLYGSAAEIVAGFLLNYSAWGYNCGQMSQALKNQYGFTSHDTAFLDTFADLPSFEGVALEVIQDGLDNGVAPWRIQRAAYLFQGYEKMFWDTMAKWGTV